MGFCFVTSRHQPRQAGRLCWQIVGINGDHDSGDTDMLTNATVLGLKARKKAYKVSDGGGLYVFVQPTGSKLWRLAYRFQGKQRTASFGAYPTISLAGARAHRDEIKALLKAGQDPATAAKMISKTVRTFRVVATEWEQKKVIAEGRSATTIHRTRWLLNMLEAGIGDRPIAEIEPPELLVVLRKIEVGGLHETVARLRATASKVFRFGIASGYCKRDPAADLRGALTAATSKPHPAVTDPKQVGVLLRAMDGVQPDRIRFALKLLALTCVRPGELIGAEWGEISGAIWDIPAHRMKMRLPHRVPLSRQALVVIEELRPLTGNLKHLFPSSRDPDQPAPKNRIGRALVDVGYGGDRHVPHGFRSTFSTIANESGKWSPDVIELQLAHVESNKVRRAYNRNVRWDERVELMSWYADYLDELRERVS
jgi:integrase